MSKTKKNKHSNTITKKYDELTSKNTILLNLSYDFGVKRDDITLLDYGMQGVYSIYDNKGIVTYIGQTNCIKHRLLQYLNGSAHIKQIGKLLDTVCLIITFDKWYRDIIESYLIKIYRPIFNIDKNTNWNSYLKTSGLFENIAINKENIKSNYPFPSDPTKLFKFDDRLKHRTFEISRIEKS